VTLTAGTLAKMALELALGVSIKLFCDNGRVHWRDLVNDTFFWLPGVQALAGDGLARQAAAEVRAAEPTLEPTLAPTFEAAEPERRLAA
jgi:hypothetical protein